MKKQKQYAAAVLLYLVLGCWRGYLALYDSGNPEPRQIYPTKVNTLPEADQQALAHGITVRNPDLLDRLLKEYLS